MLFVVPAMVGSVIVVSFRCSLTKVVFSSAGISTVSYIKILLCLINYILCVCTYIVSLYILIRILIVLFRTVCLEYM